MSELEQCTRCGAHRDPYATCPSCGHAARLRARRWIELLIDRGSFEQTSAPISADPLMFELEESYQDQFAEALRLAAADAVDLGLVDGVIPEPRGPRRVALALRARRARAVIDTALAELRQQDPQEPPAKRRESFLAATRTLHDLKEAS